MSKKRLLVHLVALGWTVGPIAALAVLLGLLAPPAGADVDVYASHDGVNRGVVSLTRNPSQPVKVWIRKNGGAASSTSPCSDQVGQNEGDEICGYDVEIHAMGSGFLVGYFDPGSGAVVYHPEEEFGAQTAQVLRATLVNTNPPPTTAPLEIGTLTVNADSPQGTYIRVWGESIVGADLALESIPGNQIAYVPEPAEILLLASGIAGLAGLRWLRRGSPSEE
jgi:hypothetical protein